MLLALDTENSDLVQGANERGTALDKGSEAPAALGGSPAFDETIYVTRARSPQPEVLRALVDGVLQRNWFTNHGELVQELEARLQTTLDVEWCRLTSSGTVGLLLALRSLDLTGSVITTPFTFPATVHALEWCGLTPVFCDVDPRTYNLDPAVAEKLIDARTSALLPVHVFGNPCDVGAIAELARRHDLRVIYDAAHAFGVVHRDRPIGRFGDLSVFSLHATKLFHTGEGGVITGPDGSRARQISLLRNFGIVSEDRVDGYGINGKLSELHAAVGLSLLDGTAEEIRERGHQTETYIEGLSPIPGIRFQSRTEETIPNHSYFPVEIDEDAFGLTRDELCVALRLENIHARKYFFPLCSENRCYADLPTAAPDRIPNAHRLARSILTLPLYGRLGLPAVERIVDRIGLIRSRAADVRQALRSTSLER
jgi:dTDP-4-amino-4,6-dideoxygalactose transaminase